MIKINVNTIEKGENIVKSKEVSQIYVTTSEQKPKKIIQIWAYVNSGIRKIFSLITSCFGSGTWMSTEKWVDTELWK